MGYIGLLRVHLYYNCLNQGQNDLLITSEIHEKGPFLNICEKFSTRVRFIIYFLFGGLLFGNLTFISLLCVRSFSNCEKLVTFDHVITLQIQANCPFLNIGGKLCTRVRYKLFFYICRLNIQQLSH